MINVNGGGKVVWDKRGNDERGNKSGRYSATGWWLFMTWNLFSCRKSPNDRQDYDVYVPSDIPPYWELQQGFGRCITNWFAVVVAVVLAAEVAVGGCGGARRRVRWTSGPEFLSLPGGFHCA